MNFPNPTQNEATPGRSQGMRIIGLEGPNQQSLYIKLHNVVIVHMAPRHKTLEPLHEKQISKLESPNDLLTMFLRTALGGLNVARVIINFLFLRHIIIIIIIIDDSSTGI